MENSPPVITSESGDVFKSSPHNKSATFLKSSPQPKSTPTRVVLREVSPIKNSSSGTEGRKGGDNKDPVQVQFAREFVEEIFDSTCVTPSDNRSISELSTGESVSNFNTASAGEDTGIGKDTDSDISFESASEALSHKQLNESIGLTAVINKLSEFHIETPAPNKTGQSIVVSQIFSDKFNDDSFVSSNEEFETSNQDFESSTLSDSQVEVSLNNSVCVPAAEVNTSQPESPEVVGEQVRTESEEPTPQVVQEELKSPETFDEKEVEVKHPEELPEETTSQLVPEQVSGESESFSKDSPELKDVTANETEVLETFSPALDHVTEQQQQPEVSESEEAKVLLAPEEIVSEQVSGKDFGVEIFVKSSPTSNLQELKSEEPEIKEVITEARPVENTPSVASGDLNLQDVFVTPSVKDLSLQETVASASETTEENTPSVASGDLNLQDIFVTPSVKDLSLQETVASASETTEESTPSVASGDLNLQDVFVTPSVKDLSLQETATPATEASVSSATTEDRPEESTPSVASGDLNLQDVFVTPSVKDLSLQETATPASETGAASEKTEENTSSVASGDLNLRDIFVTPVVKDLSTETKNKREENTQSVISGNLNLQENLDILVTGGFGEQNTVTPSVIHISSTAEGSVVSGQLNFGAVFETPNQPHQLREAQTCGTITLSDSSFECVEHTSLTEEVIKSSPVSTANVTVRTETSVPTPSLAVEENFNTPQVQEKSSIASGDLNLGDIFITPPFVDVKHNDKQVSSKKKSEESRLTELFSLCNKQQQDLENYEEVDAPVKQFETPPKVRSSESDLEHLLAAEADLVCQEIHNASLTFEVEELKIMSEATEIKRKSVSPRHASPGPGGDVEDPFKPRVRLSSSPPREAKSSSPTPAPSLTSSSDSAVAMSASGKLQRDPSSESAGGSPKSIPSMDSGICGAEVNQSEAGPDIAPAEEQFVSSEIFKDPNAFEFLCKLGGQTSTSISSRLERESLYVKFDPLVGSRDRKVFLSPCLERSQGENSMSEDSPHRRDVTPTYNTIGQLISIGTPTNHDGSPAGKQSHTPRRGDDTPRRGADVEPSLAQVQFAEELLERQKRVFEERLSEEHKRVEDLEAQIKELQVNLGESKKVIAKQVMQMNAKNEGEEQMNLVMREYEDTISRILVDKERAASAWTKEKEALEAERNQATTDLAGAELAFSDLHQKYERAKIALQGLKRNEMELKASNEKFQDQLVQANDRYKKLKMHAEEQLEKANSEIEALAHSKEMECAALQAQNKQLKAQLTNSENMIEIKNRENSELVGICDELVAKLGSHKH